MRNFEKLFFSRSKHRDFSTKVICVCDVNRLDSQQIMAVKQEETYGKKKGDIVRPER